MANKISPEESKYIINNYKNNFNYDLASHLKRPVAFISRFLFKNGLKRSKEEYTALSSKRRCSTSAEKLAKKRKKRSVRETILDTIKEKRREETAFYENKEEKFFASYKKKSLNESLSQEIENGKVPVKIDHKTVIFVSRNKCVQQEDGSWVKKTKS